MHPDDDTASIIRLGRGVMLAMLNLQSMYRKVPVHPDNIPLLGEHHILAWDLSPPVWPGNSFLPWQMRWLG